MDYDFNIPEGLVYVPKFIKQETDLDYGDVVTHEDFNELMRLNMEQGDYNTEVLRRLFTETNPENNYHIAYIDHIFDTEFGKLQDNINAKQEAIDANKAAIESNDRDIAQLNTDILNIVNGVTKVKNSALADNLTGVYKAGVHKYYGTNYDGEVGYHDVPDNISARDMGLDDVLVEGIYFKPRPASVEEYMLTEDVQLKLNREGITEYQYLKGLPQINGVTLLNNVSLATLGIQPAGDYLTSIPSEYITETELNNKQYDTTASVNSKLTNYYNKSEVDSRVNTLQNNINNVSSGAANTYARVGIGSLSNPKNGDILINI